MAHSNAHIGGPSTNYFDEGNYGPKVPVGLASPTSGYNVNPAPTGGNGPYGQVPGPVGVPPSTFQQAVDAVPGLGGAAPTQLTNNILNELKGQLSPQALKNMQDTAARFSVSSGMPGSNAYLGSLANNKNLLGNILTTQDIQHQGAQDYTSALQAIGGQQLNPSLLAEIAAHNAQLAAAPNPTQAAQQQLLNYYGALNSARSGGPAGGTGIYSQGGAPSTGSNALGFGFNTLGPSSSPTGAPANQGNPITDEDLFYMGYGNPVNTSSNGGPITDQDLNYMGFGQGSTNGTNYDQMFNDGFGIPANTVTTDTGSYYDPYSDYGYF